MTALRACLYGTLIVAALVGPGFFWNGGILEQETTSFIAAYTADRPILQKVFDPQVNDFGTYQARELSYFIDLVDAGFYVFVARTLDRALFVPLSALVASLLLVAVFLVGARRTMPNVDALVVTLLGACLVSSFQFVSTMGVFYRSGKPLLAVVVLAFLFHVRRVHQARERDSQRRAQTHNGSIAGALCLGAGLLDRQGFAYVLIACAVLGLHYWRTRQLGDLFAAACVTAAVLALYDVALAPVLIRALNGYWPDFSYQATAFFAGYSLFDPRPLWLALELLAANAGELLGGVRAGGVVLFAACCALVYARPRVWSPGHVALVFAGQVFMFAVMVRRHPEVHEWIDHRFWYYPLPYLATVLFALAMWIDARVAHWSGHRRRLLVLVLLAIVVSNVAGLNRDREIMKRGEWFGGVYAQSELLKSSFRDGAPDARLDQDYRGFFDLDRRLRRGLPGGTATASPR